MFHEAVDQATPLYMWSVERLCCGGWSSSHRLNLAGWETAHHRNMGLPHAPPPAKPTTSHVPGAHYAHKSIGQGMPPTS